MKHAEDNKTIEIPALVVVEAAPVADVKKRGRGRPKTGSAMSVKERQRLRRQKLAEAGVGSLTVQLPVDLLERLETFCKFKDETKEQIVERFLRNALRKR